MGEWAGAGSYGNRQDGHERRKGHVNGGGTGTERRFPRLVRESVLPSSSIRELTMADTAFVVTTIAVFALVAFVAKGVAKL
ncbi:hypothetical protein [Streptomyces sp. NK15101]|uniref:hypothetical protein n=1 Tax=Streptomyces sp. NK15101 TaxID=2873261 RepID=UPI001CECF42C|nr:hypothetical protein [Streptomyces sp. NK15101]